MRNKQHLPQPSHRLSHSSLLIWPKVFDFQNGLLVFQKGFVMKNNSAVKFIPYSYRINMKNQLGI
jgi:hypothetical protein